MKFVQVIEYETTRTADMEAAFEEWLRATEGKRTASHELHTQDRDNPARFIDIVEFPSYRGCDGQQRTVGHPTYRGPDPRAVHR